MIQCMFNIFTYMTCPAKTIRLNMSLSEWAISSFSNDDIPVPITKTTYLICLKPRLFNLRVGALLLFYINYF
jgi:hypothetical protein